jgi:hypothetical protein
MTVVLSSPEFGTPPPLTSRSHRGMELAVLLPSLKARHGEWAVVARSDSRHVIAGLVTYIRDGKLGPREDFEYRNLKRTGTLPGWALWLRYVGPAVAPEPDEPFDPVAIADAYQERTGKVDEVFHDQESVDREARSSRDADREEADKPAHARALTARERAAMTFLGDPVSPEPVKVVAPPADPPRAVKAAAATKAPVRRSDQLLADLCKCSHGKRRHELGTHYCLVGVCGCTKFRPETGDE